MKKHIITVATVKGGTGKTTTAGAIAEAAARDGRKTLAIDFDSQTSLSFWFKAKDTGKTVYNIFLDGDAAGAIQHTESGVDLIPGSGNLISLTTKPGSARRLEDAIEPLKNYYDFIVIDSGPTLSELLFNAIFAANEILVPMDPGIHSIRGLLAIVNFVNQAREDKPEISYAGAIITQFNKRANISQAIKEDTEAYCKKYKIPYLGETRQCVKVQEAEAAQIPLFEYAPQCTAAQDYETIYKKIVNGRRGARK